MSTTQVSPAVSYAGPVPGQGHFMGIGNDPSKLFLFMGHNESMQSFLLSNVRSAKVQAQFDKRFEQTKVTREYGVLETLEFSVIKPIKLMLNSLLGGRLGTSFTKEEREELEIYRQNQAFYKQIGKVQIAYNNYKSAVAKSIAATPEKEEAAATAEYDKAQELKGAYEALLKLAAEQAEALLSGDQMQGVSEEKITILSPQQERGQAFDRADADDRFLLESYGTDADDEWTVDDSFSDFEDGLFDEPLKKVSPEDIKELNRARREELHKVLNLKNPHIIRSVHMAESMLSVVVKVEDKVNYDQERLLDFMACFDAKVEETLTHMGSCDRKIAEAIVREDLMRGLAATTGFGMLKSINALAAMKSGPIDNKTMQDMLQHFAKVLNDLGNVPHNHMSLTSEQQDQNTIELKKSLKEIYFQRMPLISDPTSLDEMVLRVQTMQQNAYSLDVRNTESPVAQVQTLTAECARLKTDMGLRNDMIKLQQLSAAKQEADHKLALATSKLQNLQSSIVADGSVRLEENKLIIVPKEFFTQGEQMSMPRRLAESRLRTVKLTYDISKRILTQNTVDIEDRPYIKGQTAKQRKLETAALLGGLSAIGIRLNNLQRNCHTPHLMVQQYRQSRQYELTV